MTAYGSMVMSVTGPSCDFKWRSLVYQDKGLPWPVALAPGLLGSEASVETFFPFLYLNSYLPSSGQLLFTALTLCGNCFESMWNQVLYSEMVVGYTGGVGMTDQWDLWPLKLLAFSAWHCHGLIGSPLGWAEPASKPPGFTLQFLFCFSTNANPASKLKCCFWQIRTE